MEDTSWEEKLHAMTHILTNPTTSPPLHSQLFIATQIPCYLNWDYPPLLCHTSWRSKCPYQIPPPLILANGVEEARWDDEEEKRKYVRKRFTRKRIGSNVHPFIPFIVPNILLLCVLFWDPIPIDEI
ncbi:hypothetical protein ACJIZ3_013229 [Penstemon smallii]|uniref:Transmembrane protein n=1 Tax=Penstemon smallii TaxID=265156 RepID=A0ABD3USV6_9LAMI